jgi:hypothetical protein
LAEGTQITSDSVVGNLLKASLPPVPMWRDLSEPHAGPLFYAKIP